MPIDQQFTEQEKNNIIRLFYDGKTQSEISIIYDKPRRTIGKLFNFLGLKRTVAEAASLKAISPWDDQIIIEQVRALRPTHSLPQLVELLKIPLSSLDRLCKRHNILMPDNYAELQSDRMKKSWTEEKKLIASVNANKLVTPELRAKLSEGSKQLWQDTNYKQNQIIKQKMIWSCVDKRNEMSDILVAIWADEELRNRMSLIQKEIWADEELRNRMSTIQKEIWADEKKREYIRQIQLDIWKDPDYQLRMAIVRANQPMVSSIQEYLYEILDDLNIKYYREYANKPNDLETVIGPYNFDCMIPRDDAPNLLIECQGDYFHNKEDRIIRDNQKKSFINNNFPNYELKYLWEHEFKCSDKIYELIKYWMGISKIELIDFKFDNVQLLKIDVKTANKLLDKYHYLSGCGRGGILFGAFVEGNLIGVCAFSTLLRGNMPYDKNKSRELSRFCIHPRYQKKNFGSWMITRCIKMLPNEISTIISYCDTTFNHDGSLYKACNFRFDGEIRPDYWYVNDDKWVMHKKTLYNHACKMNLKEQEFADQNGYKRIYGDKKLRFIFDR